MRPIYIAAHAHSTARGAGAAAARAVLDGATASAQRVINGETLPYFRLPLAGTWQARAQAAVAQCADAIGRPRGLPVFVASSSFQAGRMEEEFHTRPIDPLRLDLGSFAGEVATWLESRDAPWCFSTACTSALTALQAAALLLRHGGLEQAVVVATELENQLSGSGFHSLGLLSATRPRPFAADRDGLVLGEAVAALHLSTDAALCPAEPWRIDACELDLDTSSLTGINPDGSVVARVITRALVRAGLAPQAVDLVKVHAAGAGVTDEAEARALQQVFGARMPPLLSLKHCIGHTLGASGLAELALLLDCLALGTLPGAPEDLQPDPAIPLRLSGPLQGLAPRHLLLISIGFGGSIGALILTRAGA